MSFPVQDAVLTIQPKGPAGLTVSGTTEAGVNDEASAALPFGVMVQQTAEGKFKLLTGSTNKLAGPIVFEHLLERNVQVSALGVLPDATISVGRRWRGWVLIEQDVAVGDAVRVRHTAGVSEQAGAFRATADSTDCFDLSTFAQWRTGGAAATDGVAEVEIDMYNGALADPD